MFTSRRNLIFILIAATFIAYFSSLGNPFIWDDEQFITSNQYVQNFDIEKIFTTNTVAGAGNISNYYRPLTTISFAIDSWIWGMNAFGFHLTNTGIHAGAGIVLFLLLLELGIGQIGSFVIALFFLIHPIQTEAVTYINSRGDSLYTVFLFGSLIIFLRYLKKRRSFDLVLCLLLYMGSLLSKEIALAGAGLYVLILGLQLFRHSGGRTERSEGGYLLDKSGRSDSRIHSASSGRFRSWMHFIYQDDNIRKALLTIGAIMLTVTVYFILRLTVFNFANLINFYGVETEYTRSLAIRLFTFCKVVWVYLGLLIWPYPLHMERAVDLVRSFWSPWVLGVVGLIGGVGIVGFWQALKKNPWILFGLLWFLIMLIPSSGIVPINGILYEHWLYLPMVGVSLIGYGLWELAQSSLRRALATWQSHIRLLRFASSRGGLLRNDVGKGILMSFVLLISIMYLFLTIRQNNIWADPITFYTYTLSFAPNSARLHNNLGMSLANSGKVREAIPEYKKALSLGLEYPQIYNNLGNDQIATGDYEDAEKNIQKALQLSPNFTTARMNLIKLYVTTKQWDKALEDAKGNEVLIQEIGRIKNQ